MALCSARQLTFRFFGRGRFDIVDALQLGHEFLAKDSIMSIFEVSLTVIGSPYPEMSYNYSVDSGRFVDRFRLTAIKNAKGIKTTCIDSQIKLSKEL